MMADKSGTAAKKRKGDLVAIDVDSEKKYFCIICGGNAVWTALFDAGDGAKRIERYCAKCAKIHVDND